MKAWIVLYLLSGLTTTLAFDPLSATVAVGAAAFSKVGKVFCRTGIKECCDDYWIKGDVQGLDADLQKKLHGQHLVISTVVKAVKAHIGDKNPSKPLVMSFNGWTGGGKSHVSKMIIENVYKLGEKSKFVHLLNSRLHFKRPDKVEEYQDQLQSWMHHNVSSCGRSIFIFDEMEHMPEGIVNVLIPFLGHNTYVDRVDFRKTIFIFISNVGGDLITQTAYQQHKNGRRREDLKLDDFQNPLELAAFNMLSGLKGSVIIQKQLIDHFVPFLPLERQHVKKCVVDEFTRMGVTNFTSKLVENVLTQLNWWPEDEKLYSKSGCTKVAHKARLVHCSTRRDEF